MPRADYTDPPPELRELGEALRLLRQTKGLKQIEVASAASISESQVSEIERGRNNPGWLLLTRVLAAMECSFGELAAALAGE